MLSFVPSEIDLATENQEIEFIKQVPQDSLAIADGLERPGGPFYLSWVPELDVGLHQATFQFVRDSGEILEYSWKILIYW